MKKILLILVMVLTLTGCTNGEEPPIIDDPTLELTQSSYEVKVDEEVDLVFTTNQEIVEFVSNEPLIATVTAGKVKGIKVGETTISLKVEGITVTATIKVISDITVTADPVALEDGQTHQLDATTKGATLAYTSSDAEVATVSETGLITGVNTGTATITISLVEAPSITKTVTVNVTKISAEQKAFAAAKSSTEALENFTVKVTIKETVGEEERLINAYYKFDGEKFEYQTTNGSVFYELSGDVYTKYTKTLEGYSTEVVSGLPSGFAPFWIGLQFSDFIYMNESYMVNYGRESIFNSFASQFSGSVVSNGKLILSDNYSQISFNLKMFSGETFTFTFDFIDINETIVTIPV